MSANGPWRFLTEFTLCQKIRFDSQRSVDRVEKRAGGGLCGDQSGMTDAGCQNLSSCAPIWTEVGLPIQVGQETIEVLFGIIIQAHPTSVAIAKFAVLAPVLYGTFLAAITDQKALKALQLGLLAASTHSVPAFNPNGRGGLDVGHGGGHCARSRAWDTMEERKGRKEGGRGRRSIVEE